MVHQSYMGYPLVNIQKTMEKSTILEQEINYFYGYYNFRYGISYHILIYQLWNNLYVYHNYGISSIWIIYRYNIWDIIISFRDCAT